MSKLFEHVSKVGETICDELKNNNQLLLLIQLLLYKLTQFIEDDERRLIKKFLEKLKFQRR